MNATVQASCILGLAMLTLGYGCLFKVLVSMMIEMSYVSCERRVAFSVVSEMRNPKVYHKALYTYILLLHLISP